MRTILNLVPVRSGGGQQQALNLLAYLARQDQQARGRWLVLVGKHSAAHKWVQDSGALQYRALNNSYVGRSLFDVFLAQRVINAFRADAVFHFTVPWHRVSAVQVVRSVYSNLYFPEVPFWPKRPILTYLKKRIIDRFRLAGTLMADGLIFENRAMQSRAANLFEYPLERMEYIRPSVANYLLEGDAIASPATRSGKFRVLYLSTWHPNKGMGVLPQVAALLTQAGTEVEFVLSLRADDPGVRRALVSPAKKLGVLGAFTFLGDVHPADVANLVPSCDAVILLSQLECFSANVSEAWTFRRPLIISDLEWARSECGVAAIYVDRSDPVSIFKAITELSSDARLSIELARLGVIALSKLNSIESKCEQQINFIEKTHALGKKT